MIVYMPILMDNVAVNAQPTIPGRININQAPRAILVGIPGMEETIVDEILNQRSFESTSDAEAVSPPARDLAPDLRHRHARRDEEARAVHLCRW